MKNKYFLLLALICTSLFAAIHGWCTVQPDYDYQALMIANGLLALLSLLSYFMLRQKIKTDRPQAFVNGVYGATLIRLMVCMASILLYLLLNQGQLHKPSIFVMMGLYLVYTGFETLFFARMAKQKQ